MERDGSAPTQTSLPGPQEDLVATAKQSSSELMAAATRLGRFSVLNTIGEGGMGRVYEAYDPQLDRLVALKVLFGPDGPARQSRLVKEAHALAKLSHPNVVTVHEVGMAGSQCFVAMERVEGITLRQWLQNNPVVGQRDVKQALTTTEANFVKNLGSSEESVGQNLLKRVG